MIINYTYDLSNRLLKAQTDYSNSSFNVENKYDYDGNLKTLKKYGAKGNVLDDFNYHYITGTNKLSKVSGTIDQFTYDYNGNMTGDELQHNYGLKYDHRNLLTEISRVISENENELTRYYYDEAGNRIRKLVLRHWSGGGGVPDPPDWGNIENLHIYEPEGEGGDGWSIYKNEFYVRGVGGNELAIYNNDQLEQWNVWGTDNVGKITKEEEEEFNFYYLKDHLGSIRAVIDEDNTVVSAQDYDMWGYLLENRTFDIEREKYKFTGKERDDESSYDYFGARYYVSRIGRWGSVDPLFEKHYDFSPYVYVLDNSMIFIDPEGRQIDFSMVNMRSEATFNYTISDLQLITGLWSLSMDHKTGYLQVNPLEFDRKKSFEGSRTARNFLLMGIIGSKGKISGDVFPGKGSRFINDPACPWINLDPDQIDRFISGVNLEAEPKLNSLTMGYGMVFLHELGHSAVGGYLKDPPTKSLIDNFGVEGGAVEFMNIIREELGPGWGQRKSHKPRQIGGLYVIPFDKPALSLTKNKQMPKSHNMYISY